MGLKIINQKSELMKLKFGAIVVDGRGKIGGHVASKNGAGAYLRTKVTPTNPQTERQSFVRALFAAITTAWSGLTASQITAWNEAVADWTSTNVFGDLKKPSGKALFQRLNNQAQIAGFPAFTAVPPKVALPDAVVTAAPIGIAATTLALTGMDTAATTRVMVFASPAVSNGTTNVKSKMRMIYSQLGSTYSATDAFDAYADKFGTPVLGQKIFIGVKYVVSSGQASPLQILQATVSA